MAQLPVLMMSCVILDFKSTDFRLRSLAILEKKVEKSLAIIDRRGKVQWRETDRYYWKYCLSLIRYIAARWRQADKESHSSLTHLHDVGLRQAIIRSVHRTRNTILASRNYDETLREWDELWTWS